MTDAEWTDRLNALLDGANAKDAEIARLQAVARAALADLTPALARLDRLVVGEISSSPRLLKELSQAVDRAAAGLEAAVPPDDVYLDHAPGPYDEP